MKNPPVSVIIPCFNEENTIGEIVQNVRSLYPDYEIIVVDDGSSDQTEKMAIDAGAIAVRHPYNIGNGASIKSGIRKASGEIIVFMDGDGQHDPEDLPKLLKNFPEFDMVVGARSMNQQSNLMRGFGNIICNSFASYVAKFNVKDLTSGFRAVKANVAKKFLYLLPNQYSYPTTSTLYILRTGRSLKYVSINAQHRKSGKSNIHIFRDGVRFLLIIVKICVLFSPLRVFLPLSAIFLTFGMVRYFYTYITINQFTNMSALLISTSVLVFLIGLVSEQICQIAYERSEKEHVR
jgi:glycosyltransferase involved in cell wall biosynthesis